MVSGKLSLVTGGASGIGRATCQALANQGSTVVVADINTEGAKDTVRTLKDLKVPQGEAITRDDADCVFEVRGSPGLEKYTDLMYCVISGYTMSVLEIFGKYVCRGHIAVTLDVSDVKSVEYAMSSIKELFRETPRICVNCAGVAYHCGILQCDDAVSDRLMEVNVKGTMNVTKYVCKELVEVNLPGSIVNVTSVAIKGMENLSIYGASKGAVSAFTKSAGKEFGRYGIRCNAVCPGVVLTPMLASMPRDNAETFMRCIAMGRVGKPEEVAEVIAFVASEKASYMTSTNVYVDGGLGVPG